MRNLIDRIESNTCRRYGYEARLTLITYTMTSALRTLIGSC